MDWWQFVDLPLSLLRIATALLSASSLSSSSPLLLLLSPLPPPSSSSSSSRVASHRLVNFLDLGKCRGESGSEYCPFVRRYWLPFAKQQRPQIISTEQTYKVIRSHCLRLSDWCENVWISLQITQ